MISTNFNVLIITWLNMEWAHTAEGNINGIPGNETLMCNQKGLLATQQNTCFPLFLSHK